MVGGFAGSQYVAWADVMCTHCNGMAVAVQFLSDCVLPCFPQTLTLLRCIFAQHGHMQNFCLPLGKSVEDIIQLISILSNFPKHHIIFARCPPRLLKN